MRTVTVVFGAIALISAVVVIGFDLDANWSLSAQIKAIWVFLFIWYLYQLLAIVYSDTLLFQQVNPGWSRENAAKLSVAFVTFCYAVVAILVRLANWEDWGWSTAGYFIGVVLLLGLARGTHDMFGLRRSDRRTDD